MTFSLSKRLWVGFLIVPILAGLISLGLRLPDLAGFRSSGPKPRPRAVIQNQIHKCKEFIDQYTVDCLAEHWDTELPATSFLVPPISKSVNHAPHQLLSTASRAPPLLLASV